MSRKKRKTRAKEFNKKERTVVAAWPHAPDGVDGSNGFMQIENSERGDWIFRASRKNLALCLDWAPCGIVIHTTRRGRLLYINRAAFDLSGYTIHETPTGKAGAILFAPGPSELKELREKMKEACLAGSTAVVKLKHKNGEIKDVEIRVTMLSKRMMVSMWTDVTRREQAERALRESKRELEDRVNERTAELVLLNERLREEIEIRKTAEIELEKSREELRNLSEHLQQAREEERTRIAREVHDQLSQYLSALKIDIARLDSSLPDGRLKTEMTAIDEQLGGIIQAARNICTELRPPGFEPSALAAAIEWHVARYEKRTGIHCTVRISSDIQMEEKDLAVVVFRILQETMANVARHAEATTLYVGIIQNRRNLVLTVRDNGKGIMREDLLKTGCYGIIGMRERIRFYGGKLRFSSLSGKGTTVTVSIPASRLRVA